MAEQFHDILRRNMDDFVHLVYKLTARFPRSELYGSVSQLRRAALSAVLNYVEGYARKRRLVKINFFETAYGSTQESKYLLEFALREGWVREEDVRLALKSAHEISAMLWKTIEGLRGDKE